MAGCYIVLLAVVSLFLPAGGYWYESCPQIEDEGFYCTNDLTGYQDCVYDEDDGFYLGLRGEGRCPEGTRCSCYVDQLCKSNRTEDICRPYETAAPFDETFSLSYQHHEYHKSLNPHIDYLQDYRVKKNGEIIRDSTGMRYLSKEGNNSELILQNEDGTLTRYRVDTEKRTCRKSNVNHLPFFPQADIRKYTLLSSIKKTSRSVVQKWYYQTGRNSWAYDFYKKWLTVTFDPVTNTALPLKYYQEFVGGEAEYDIFTTINYSVNKDNIGTVIDEAWSSYRSFCE